MMSWRFRQSFTVIPGLRLNLSKSGLSASIGSSPFTLNVGAHGVTGTASIPGTGISARHHFGHNQDPDVSAEPSSLFLPPSYNPSPDPRQVSHPFSNSSAVREIHSASTELLTSESLKDLKQLIQSAFQQHQEIKRDLDEARNEKVESEMRFDSWQSGFLLKRIFKTAFLKREEDFGTASEKVLEFEEQLRLTTIATHIDVEKEQAELYFRLRDEFAALCDCKAIWDIKAFQATDRVRERTTASTRLTRQQVRFRLGECDLIQWGQKVPHLTNAKGGELYLYPGFILYRAAREAFSLIGYHDIEGKAESVRFQEDENVPSDSIVVGQTWAKANKDGSRDKRFAGNYQIPIAHYGSVTLKSDHGLWEEFHFSNPQRLVSFLTAFNAFTASFAAVADV